MNIADTIAKCKPSKKIEEKLKYIKVSSAFISFFAFSYSIFSIMRGGIPKAGLFLFLSADFLRVSYNSYINAYCSIFIRKYFGSVSKTGETIFRMVQSAVGLTEPADDPLIKMKSDVVWNILVEDTLTKALYLKVSHMKSISLFLMVLFCLHISIYFFCFLISKMYLNRNLLICVILLIIFNCIHTKIIHCP